MERHWYDRARALSDEIAECVNVDKRTRESRLEEAGL